jgi:uncharacterized membrane protein YfhO
MLQARIPPGRHVIELRYWPTAFSAGLVLALVAVVVLAGVPLILMQKRKRSGAKSRHEVASQIDQSAA